MSVEKSTITNNMLGLLGAGIGLAGSIYGGSQAAKQRKKMERYLNEQDSENKAWFNSNYYANYLERSDTQALMKNLRDILGKQNKAASNMAVVTGATPEQQAIQKEQSNKVISDTYSKMGAIGQQWKDGIMNTYLNRKQDIANQKMGMMQGQANSYEGLSANGINVMGGSLGNLLNF